MHPKLVDYAFVLRVKDKIGILIPAGAVAVLADKHDIGRTFRPFEKSAKLIILTGKAGKDKGVGSDTHEIVEYVQNAVLCIADKSSPRGKFLP
jgi:hypothetical protein